MDAVDLSNNESRSRSVVEAQAHQRAVLVAGLIDSVFGAISRPGAQPLAEYSRAVVSDRALERNRGSDVYLALLDASGRPLGRSFQIKLWPTLVFMRDGIEVGRVVRPHSAADVRRELEQASAAKLR